ncbi:MAG TPA: recombinase family protein [Kribbellaceae bacterium]|nr:recombinase family protein [Kribbellaceae bacterium]
MTKEGVGYLRISDDREGLERGIERQRADITARAKRERVRIIRWYEDNDRGASRYSRKPRKDYLQMLADVKAGVAGAFIYSYSNSRLTRRNRELEDLLDLHEQTGVQVRTIVSGDDNLSTADGRMVARLKVTMDAAEAERISERVRRQTRERADAGRPHGGRRPYGYPDGRRLDPVEHGVITEVAGRVLNGETLMAVARDLNRRGVATVTGNPWSANVVRQMLTSPRIAGFTGRGGEPVARGAWEPAIGELMWRELRAMLLDPARATPRAGRRSLLVGLALCGECGRPMTSFITHRRHYYVCRGCRLWRAQLAVDRYVEGVMVVFLEHALETEPEDEPRVNAQERKVEQLRRRIAATTAQFTNDDAMTPGQLRELMRSLNAKLAAEEAKLLPPRRRRLQAGLAGPDAAERWELLSLDQKRANIDDLLEIRLLRARSGQRRFDEGTVELRRKG